MSGLFAEFMIHTLRVHAKTFTLDSTGSPVPHTMAPVTVKGKMRSISARESGASGLSLTNTWVFTTTDEWNFGAVTDVEWLDKLNAAGEPRTFDQHGSSLPSEMGWETDHTKVYLVERGADLG
ncbi:hypothetical protein SAMN04489743_2843 [Pseudarthrobacter equi]|uniref:Uncharacterized protein n=1 Tax=Pseudarthrobacter equi TaxID=728066 RepID=A0A1H2A8A9_9MICC|nr:hypothetical protein [Pseudarthrobacter equi]SDT42198.1 hypothetical protein SAMN04489743_2843 [Pseudarthrobacter equi]